MQLDLSDKTALVTGASAGLGAAIAGCLARKGVHLAITARRIDPLRALATKLEAGGAMPVRLIQGDLTRQDDLERIAAEAIEGLGRVDILINCAGASSPVSIEDGDTV